MILVPALMLMVLLALQAAIYFHAANVALAAAARGAAVGATRSASAHDAAIATVRAVDEMGSDLASTPSVDLSADDVTVTAVVRAPRLVPFFPATVSRHATEPRERHIPEDER